MTQMTPPSAAPAQGTFVPAEFLSILGTYSRADGDACEFGVVQLDDAGNVVQVNRYQSELAGIPISQFEGKHYFTRIAPCTNNALIYGTFKKGIAAGELNVVIPYTFTFKMRPTNVRVHLYRDQPSGRNFAFCTRA